KDVAERKRLYKEEFATFAKSADPMIQLVLLIDEEARKLRKTIEAQDEIKRQAYGQIAKARFALEGASSYPDATFTLRLAFGQTKGYEENGQEIPYQTTLRGLYERADSHRHQPPFNLPESWATQKHKLDLSTPFNFVSTADII